MESGGDFLAELFPIVQEILLGFNAFEYASPLFLVFSEDIKVVVVDEMSEGCDHVMVLRVS